MKSELKNLIFYVLLFSHLIVGCTKDYSFEGGAVSRGSLKSLTGDCLPQQINGTYTKGVALTDSNYIQIQVRVTQQGSYTIKSDSLYGMSFSGSGYFSNVGIITIFLTGKGKPTQSGSFLLYIKYDSSVCLKSISVDEPPVVIHNGYFLQGAPGKCYNYDLKGDYLDGTPLTDKNTINLNVNVVSPVSYSISTNTVNGYSFSASGTFTKTGIQIVTLKGSGTPIASGKNNFIFNGQNTSCSLTITVYHALAITGQDHFPLTALSNWTYNDLNHFPDTIYRAIILAMNINGKVYSDIHETHQTTPPVDYFCRKTGDIYYEYSMADKYTTSVKYFPQEDGDILFLKENLKTGDTWVSDQYVGTNLNTQKMYLQYNFTCVDANATVSIYDNTFTNVYKILLQPQVHDDTTTDYKLTGESRDLYYAKGIGLIYTRIEKTNNAPLASQLRNWQVN